MVEIDITYEGDLLCTAKHAPSRTELHTDAPVDNHGKGSSFSPTDLLASSLGLCMITTMGILARREGWPDLTGSRVHVVKEMTAEKPRKVARLNCTLTVPAEISSRFSGEVRSELERCALNCPVMLSLSPQIDAPVSFDWQA